MRFGLASAHSEIGRALGGPAALTPGRLARPMRPSDFWRVCNEDWYTCIPSAGGAVDPAVLRELHTFYPGAIPMEWRQKWIPPNSYDPIVVRYHVVGVYNPTPREGHVPFYVEMPARPKHPVPNILDFVAQDDDRADGGPPGYMPFDFKLVAYLRRIYNEHRTAKELGDLIKARYERRMAMLEKLAEEAEYAEGDLKRWLYKRLAQFSDVEWAEYYRGRGKRKRVPKPFVDLGSAPTAAQPSIGG